MVSSWWKKNVENNETSTSYSLNHAWNYSNINKIRQCFNFSTCKQGKTQKKIKNKKIKWCDFEAINVSCIVCIKRNATSFSALQAKTNSFNKKGKHQASGHHKMGFAQNNNKKHEYKSHFLC